MAPMKFGGLKGQGIIVPEQARDEFMTALDEGRGIIGIDSQTEEEWIVVEGEK